MKFIQSKKDKVPRRPFLDSNPLRDWVGILGCLFAAVGAYQEISYNYFTFDGVVTTQFSMNNLDNFTETLIGASIDGILQAGISFGLVVLILGGARKLISNQSQPLVISTNKSKRKRVILLIFLAVIFGFFAAYGNASSKEVKNSDAQINDLIKGLKPVPLSCRAQGDDEICISGLQSSESVSLNYKLTYASVRVIGTDEIWSSSWTLYADCSANSVTVSSIEFYGLNGAKVSVSSSVKNDAKTGMENDLSAVLSEC